ncbi:hypothetical protein GJ654_08030 [Rhodoblastus acidophilus]|uniref:Uncharacterized protein n=1 Tax=Rhodoblastus acidophilus TaxID=1074 RepID=A0A6N8DP40_RHOAC|nr:hypothetical protein [Rhodoblastus acidophilus]MCW2273917.1 hypothetical protein [Rhodoblastus acidophilus]MTV30941.1 hypothetical protein [Rhodoblastus acidophilus]
MNAQVIPFPRANAWTAERLLAFDAPPTAEALVERARLAASLSEAAQAEQAARSAWAKPRAGLKAAREAADFFWERCVERVAVETVFDALRRSGADEALQTRVRDHFSAFCHSL